MKNTERFSQTVEHYQQYRPNYPKTMIDFLLKQKVLSKDKVVADIGSGTGIFTQQLLALGAKVFAIEPNGSMRESAQQQLSTYPYFTSINGTAEATTLMNNGVEVISVATAFHWFNRETCQEEFKRILRDNGDILLFWNLRLPKLLPILQGYENLLKKYCPNYKGIPSQQIAESETLAFFAKDSVTVHQFENQQTFDLDGLVGRLRSTSYALTPAQDNYNKMLEDLTHLFNQYQTNGQVIFPYTTKLYLGKL